LCSVRVFTLLHGDDELRMRVIDVSIDIELFDRAEIAQVHAHLCFRIIHSRARFSVPLFNQIQGAIEKIVISEELAVVVSILKPETRMKTDHIV